MAVFRFRLEAKLKLTERVLQDTQRAMALEIKKLHQAIAEHNNQQKRLHEAMAGQRQASAFNPLTLGLWQTYVTDQLLLLREKENALKEQQLALNQARKRVVEAHRETEKFQRLKHKRLQEYLTEELRKEQAKVDEVAQRRYGGLNH